MKHLFRGHLYNVLVYYMKSNKSNKSTKSRTKKQRPDEKDIVIHFLEMLNTIKLFHWKTTGYAIHKATDDVHSSLSGKVDSFVEIMLGKHGGRIQLQSQSTLTVRDYASSASDSFKQEMERYKIVLQGLSQSLDASKDSDLLNIRDEMLGQLNQLTYLLTLH